MTADNIVDIDERARKKAGSEPESTASSEDSVALDFVAQNLKLLRYVPAWKRWLEWDGKRWRKESTGAMYGRIRELIREAVAGTKLERGTATAGFVAGVERLSRYDQRIVVQPEQFDADPWLLNTQSGIVDLRDGSVRPHDPRALMTRLTAAALEPMAGAALWTEFIDGITGGDTELAGYLQRVAGYCATGMVNEDVLIYLFGLGSNGKSSFAEALNAALGDYATVFAADVLMEAKGERHPTELAQFMGARLALSSEPASNAAWNDSRVKSLTGDATISARYMHGDFFTFPRTHKTMLVGNHMPRLNAVTHAIRRRVQMVPFRAVFAPSAGPGMRERLKAESLGAILAWIVAGVAAWRTQGTNPASCVRALTAEYLSDQDDFSEWLAQSCERDAAASELSSTLYKSYCAYCERNGNHPKSNMALSRTLTEAGFQKKPTMVGKLFLGLAIKVI